MAFDQNSIPKDLRPLNVARSLAEEPLILPASSAARTVECFPTNSVRDATSPESVPLFYPASVSDAGIVSIGYGTVASGAAWCSPAGVPIVHPSINPAVGFNYSPNFGNRIIGGNAPDLASSVVTVAHGYTPNLGNWVGGNGVDKVGNDAVNGVGFTASQGNTVVVNAGNQVGSIPSSGTGCSPTTGQRPAGNGVEQASDEGEDSVSGKKVKFLCSYGGKILPRPSDGTLRYVGGQTRIISFKKDVSFNELVQKMSETYGQPVVIKYQLPDEDLDALVSVSCPDDLDNMMDEHAKLIETCSDGSAKLRVFLFSASELDSSGVIPFGDLNDSGQRYVDAVNGITDGITWKESITSATSTQNSDFSGTEALDSSFPGQGAISGAPSTCVSSPKKDMAPSHDTAAKLVGEDHGPAAYSDASANPQVMSVAKSSPIPTSTLWSEAELDGSVPPLSQQQVLLQQSRVDIPQVAPYMQPFVDPRQEVTSHADFVQLTPHAGFPNPHLLGKAGSVFTQQQLYDNPGLTSHQIVPTVQMTMAPPVSHVGLRPNVIQPLMQPQQNLMEPYHDESTSGPRIFQFPVGQSYSASPVQVPSVVVGGGYGWVQVPSQEHVIFHDGLIRHQQVMIPEKIQRAEDCYMCQKSLPHAHSDPVVRDQGDSGASPTSDSIPSYYSLPVEDNLKAQATNKVMANEGVIEQGVVIKPRVISNGEPLVGVPCADKTGLSHNLEPQPEGERALIQKSDGFDHPRNTVLQDVIGRASDKQLPSDGIVGTAPVSYPDDVIHQPLLPVGNWIKQDVHVNKLVSNDMPPVCGVSIQTSECRIHESPKEYTNELAGIVSKADAVDNWVPQDHLRPMDGRMDTLRVYNPEVYVNDDHSKLPFDKSNGNDQLLVHESQHLVDKEVLDKNVGRSHVVFDASQIMKTDMLPCSYSDMSYGHNSRPVECNEVTQPPVWGIPGSNPQLKGGNHHKDDIMPSSIPLAGAYGEVQDSSNSLFSNQDPWNMHHDTYYPPPRPNKVPLKKETYFSKNNFGENLLGNSAEQSLEAQLESSLCQPFKQNLTLEHVSTEDQIKQELQAVAEGVAASVLHSSTPSNPDLHAGDMPGHEEIEDGDVKAKAQDVKNKPPEKQNLGFPGSDGLGRLQVIKNCDLEELRELGSGTFGTVYHGKWRGSDVAIKRINDRCFAGKPSEQERMRADFWNEAIKLADLHHPNVVAFYGIVLDGPGGSIATVTEYMVNGSLRNALQKNERSLDKRKRLLIAMDVAFGMEYLHGKNIVHFDLKSDNLLVNLRDPHRPICKVGDLGLSKAKRQTLISGGVQGTLPWMAPELLNGSSSLVSEKVDVFSFGIVMWELLTGDEPYADLHYGAIIGGILSNTLRPPVPESCDPEWRSLMERCWSSEPSERPSFTEIADELRSMAAKIPPKGQSQQQQQPPSSQPQVQK